MQRYKWLEGGALVPTIDDGDYVLYYQAMLEIGRLTALACERQEIIEEQKQEIAAWDNLIALHGKQIEQIGRLLLEQLENLRGKEVGDDRKMHTR